ncbi:MAG: tRNA guanosine(34) transglycosylase Tgt [Armatimonadetes bacterium]|nr:tRNA guanosine(34) transglycosylase Tgt [Armatimonadota bacterium]
MRFEIDGGDPHSLARAWRLYTAHGVLKTPVFIASATHATIKGLAPEEVAHAGIQVVAVNGYHLWLRPGIEVIREAGGVHRFMNWKRPILSDSGGFQVFSLARSRTITRKGVRFQSHIDGSPKFMTPESSIEAQNALGTDIAMIFDECVAYPATREYVQASVELTLQWAKRSKAAHSNPHQHLFGIVQGGAFEDLRRRSAEETVKIGFPGYALGGLSVGEPQEEMLRVIQATVPYLPEDRPRYVMGVGTPADMLACLRLGIDIFDCVLPNKNARHGTLFTSEGVLKIKNARFRTDQRPLDADCDCDACRKYTRAYLRHLWMAEEPFGARLLTLHNLRHYARFMERVREAIVAGTLSRMHVAEGRAD